MGDTNIEWTDKTWNPQRGCSRVSPGCVNCYAERQAARFAAPGIGVLGEPGKIPSERPAAYPAGPFFGFVTRVNGHPAWTGKVELVEKHLGDPLHWKTPCRVFVNSMSDLFHEDLPDEAIDRVFGVMAWCRRHTFQILTKRADRMRAYSNRLAGLTRQERGVRMAQAKGFDVPSDTPGGMAWPLPNVHFGVSTEDQQRANERVAQLLLTPASVRFVSYEPALSHVDFTRIEHEPGGSGGTVFINSLTGKMVSVGGGQQLPKLDWVIIGGESGPGARPFDLEWARSVVQQCAVTGTKCFVKQLGSAPHGIKDHISHRGDPLPRPDGFYRFLTSKKGGDMDEWPEDLRIREFPHA